MLNTVALLLAFGFTTPAPQSSPRPQFAGAWVLDKTGLSPDSPRPFWVGCIWQCEIVQTDTELRVTPKDGSTSTFTFGGQPEISRKGARELARSFAFFTSFWNSELKELFTLEIMEAMEERRKGSSPCPP